MNWLEGVDADNDVAEMSSEDRAWVREMFGSLEIIHDVTYFSKVARTAYVDFGLPDVWSAYFGTRGGVLGEAPPSVIGATFYNFDPAMVRRYVPAIWELSSPEELLDLRRRSARDAIVGKVNPEAIVVESYLGVLEDAIANTSCSGLVLFAGNQQVSASRTGDLIERLWQCATSIREHRGDGHLSALVMADLGGLESHLLKPLRQRMSIAKLESFRGWSESDIGACTQGLALRGLIDLESAELTDAGQQLRDRVELETDEMSYRLLSRIPRELRIPIAEMVGSIARELGTR